MTDYILKFVDLLPWSRIIAVTTVDVVFLYSLLVGSLSMFLQECYKKHMIFHQYFRWLEAKYEYYPITFKRKWQLSLLKVGGICVYCQNFWINTILFPIFFGLSPYYILTIGGSYLSVELIRLIKKHG